MTDFKYATWKAPQRVTALSTTKKQGYSHPPYDSNNLALHVGDNEKHVLQNRHQLANQLKLSQPIVWLEQTHSTICIIPEKETSRTGDALVTRSNQYPLAIMTADCLPITLCNQQGNEIAAIHAGWRGLFNGIIENTVHRMLSPASSLLAWIGPAISQPYYEIGEEVYESFLKKNPQNIDAFHKIKEKKWLANLPLLAEYTLNSLGIEAVTQSNLCTFEKKDEFYSYRRTPQTGRIATLIWLNEHPGD